MSDFVHEFWNYYVAGVALIGIIGCALFLWSHGSASYAIGKTTGHSWDEDLEEFNNPLPKWWSWLFYITVVFALGYLVYFPGLGSFPGMGGWTSVGQYDDEEKEAAAAYAPLYQRFRGMNIPAIAKDAQAMEMGQRLFRTYCMQCHGIDGGGRSGGFPSLTDADWLYGGEPETIKESISNGRQGVMTPNDYLGEDTIRNLANYVRSVANLPHDATRAQRGREAYMREDVICRTCHGDNMRGDKSRGAPNLTDDVWLYGSEETTIIETITHGRNTGGKSSSNKMPAWKDFLDDDKTKLLAAYVYGLSNK